MGPMQRDEWKLIGIMSVMFVLWVLSSWPAIYPPALAPLSNIFLVSMLGGIAMFLPGIGLFKWREVQNATGWDTLAALFREGGDPRWCWCQFWRMRAKDFSALKVPQPADTEKESA